MAGHYREVEACLLEKFKIPRVISDEFDDADLVTLRTFAGQAAIAQSGNRMTITLAAGVTIEPDQKMEITIT